MLRRTLTSAALAASLFAADVVVLTLYLNPDVALRREALALFFSLFVPYVVAATLALLAIAAALHALGWPRALHPPVAGAPWFTTLSTLATLAAGTLFCLNLISYRYAIPVPFVRGLTASTAVVAVAFLVLLGFGLDALFFPRRLRAASAPFVVLAASSAVVGPLALRPDPTPLSPKPASAVESLLPVRRVVLLGIDGLGPVQVEEGIAAGRLPVLASLGKRGALGPLASLRPTEGPPVWTSIFTGRLPRDHGVKSFSTYRLRLSSTPYELLPKGALVALLERAGLVSTAPVTAASRRCRSVWEALNAFGVRAGVVRFWGTHPPERVQGFMLSNHFYRLRGDPARAVEALYPPDMASAIRDRIVTPQEVDKALVGQFVDLAGGSDDRGWRRDLVERALAPDLTYQRAGTVLRAAYDPAFFASYAYGLDVVGHAFLRHARPERFGDVSPAEARRLGRAFDQYLVFLCQWIGDLEKSLRSDEILFVVSGYGMDAVPWWRRQLGALVADSDVSGSHDAAPDGFLLAVGSGIRQGASVSRASVLDLAPTVLYLMGLPVARDMEGRVLSEIVDDDFARAHPLTYIPSYEGLAPAARGPSPDLELPPFPPLPEEIP